MKIERTPEEVAAIKTQIEAGNVTDPDLKAFLDEVGATRVMSATSETTYKTNVEKAAADNATKNAYTQLDARIKELTGLDRENLEKTSDYLARGINKLKEQVGKPDEAAQAKITELEGKLNTATAQIEAEKTAGKTALITERARLEAEATIEGLRASMPEMVDTAWADIKAARLARFLAENVPVADEAGGLVYTDPKNNGAKRLDAAGNNAPLTTSALVAGYFTDLKKPGTDGAPAPAGGAGAGAGKAGANDAGKGAPAPGAASEKGIKGLGARPAELTSQVKVWEHLKQLGHTNSTPGFNETYAGWITNADGSQLPEE